MPDIAASAGREHPGGTDLREVLRRCHLRATEQRVAVLGALLAHADNTGAAVAGSGRRTHQTVLQVQRQLSAAGKRVNLATIYRTLAVLDEAGILHTAPLPNGHLTFGLDEASHHHAVCVRCNVAVEVPATTLTAGGVGELCAAAGFSEMDSGVVVYGVCEDCRRVGST